MTPTHSRGASGRIYRYYAPLPQQRGQGRSTPPLRLPAARFERVLRSLVERLTGIGDHPLDHLVRVDLDEAHLTVHLPAPMTARVRRHRCGDERIEAVDDHVVQVSVPWQFPSGAIEIEGISAPARRDPVLINALRAAHAMLEHDGAGRPVLNKVPRPRYERRLARLAFLSPALQAAIIEGRQPATLTLARIVRGKLPACWKEQAKWAARRA